MGGLTARNIARFKGFMGCYTTEWGSLWACMPVENAVQRGDCVRVLRECK